MYDIFMFFRVEISYAFKNSATTDHLHLT